MMVLLLAFLVKAIIPAGFMPGATSDGYTTMVICSGMGEKTVLVPNDQNAPDEQSADHGQNDLCAYQAASSQKILIDIPPVFSVQISHEAASFDTADTSIHHITMQRAHNPRAPPLPV